MQTTCTVEGMTCGNCALTISKVLQGKGAQAVSANAATGEVSFKPPEGIEVDRLYDAIDSLGYHVVRGEDDHAHHHDHGDEVSWVFPLCIALTIPLLAHMWLDWPLLHNPLFQFVLTTPVFVMGWWQFGGTAIRSLRHGVPNMNVLILLGATAAYVYSLIGWLGMQGGGHQYLFFETAASIITLVMAGNWLEHRTVKSTTAAIDALVKLQPSKARLVMVDSIGKESIMETEAKFLKSGDVVLVHTGEAMPVDGQIVSGEASVDESMITGEAMPALRRGGDEVVGGTIVASGSIRVKATTVGSSSILSGIIRAVKEAQSNKAPLQLLADKISGIFVPTVLGISILTFLVNYYAVGVDSTEAMMRSIAVLVISCPCAMGLATPAAAAAGLGRAARSGILIKGSDTLQRLKGIKQIVFDKTGTLTTGKMAITDFEFSIENKEQFRSIVASLARSSAHPVSLSLARIWADAADAGLTDIVEERGSGMIGIDKEGARWQLGSRKWLEQAGGPEGWDLYVARDGKYAGALRLADEIRPEAADTVSALHKRGYKTILLSGDRADKCLAVGKALGISDIRSEQSPLMKSAALSELMTVTPTAMVGDGINDAPSLAAASVGISLSDASHIAMQSAQVVLSGNRLSALPKALRLGILTEQTIKTNLFWAFLYNVLAIPVAAAGYLSPVWGAGVMALSDVVLILNSGYLAVRNID
jgi:Cu+-exporting ATPase